MNGSIRKKGNSYYYRIHSNNINIERVGGKTKQECEKALRQALLELDETGKVFKESKLSFSYVLDSWLKSVKNTIKPGTYNDYKNVINTHLAKEPFFNYRIGTITIQMLQDYINTKCSQLSKSTMKSHFVVLNGTLDYAVFPLNLIRESPMHYVKRPKAVNKLDLLGITEPTDDVPIISIDDFIKIKSLVNPYLQLVFDIGFYTGARLGEICALNWSDIDFNNRTITIKKNLYYDNELKLWCIGTTKNGLSRTIDISDYLISTLKTSYKAHLSDKMLLGENYKAKYINALNMSITDTQTDYPVNFICTQKNGQNISTQYVKTCITRYIRKGGKGIDFHFHMLRHTHATMLMQNGVNLKDIQVRLGHTKLATTQEIYSHATKESQKTTADLFDNLIRGKMVGK